MNAATRPFGLEADTPWLDWALDGPERARCMHDWVHGHGVVVLRGARFTAAQYRVLATGFGALMPVRAGASTVPGHPDVTLFNDGGHVAQILHHDHADTPRPPSYTLLYMSDVPVDATGSVWFDTAAAFEALPRVERERMATLRVVHQHDPQQVLAGAADLQAAATPRAERERGQRHPLVQRHAVTGRAHLFLPLRRDCPIDGLTDDDSRAVLDFLWAHVRERAPRFESRFRNGDLYVWDNRSTVHDRGAWPRGSLRRVLGISVAGSEPAAVEEGAR